MASHNLKKCPFCGNTASLWERGGRYGSFVFVQCDVCSAETKKFSLPNSDNDENWASSFSAERAVEAWNRRCGDAE